MFNNIPHTKSCTSSTRSTLCGTLVYKANDTPNDFVGNTTSKLSDQLVRGKKTTSEEYIQSSNPGKLSTSYPQHQIFRLFKYTTPHSPRHTQLPVFTLP